MDLREQNETLKERIRQLEQALGYEMDTPPKWEMTRGEAIIFSSLIVKGFCSYNCLQIALHFDQWREIPDKTSVHAMMWRVRRKIRGDGLEIESVPGRGYRISPETKKRYFDLFGRFPDARLAA